MQDRKSHHIIQLPTIKNKYLCPLETLTALLRSKNLSPQDPLFASIRPPHKPIIDTHVRDALRHILIHRNISPVSHGFHTLRRSGATFAFDHSVPLQNIMSHGLWRSSAVLPSEYIGGPFSGPFHLLSFHPSFFLAGLGVLKFSKILNIYLLDHTNM